MGSFGSVCLGSLIVAFLQAVRAILRCIERLIRYFNKYAFAQCAIYGTSFVTSAKATWNLFMTRGLTAIINDDLTGIALVCGSMIGAVVSAIAGYVIGYAFYGNDDDEDVSTLLPVAL